MAEDSGSGLSIDKNPGRWLVFAFGALLCSSGVQAMLTSQTMPVRVTVPTVIGGVLVLLSVFWKTLKLNKTAFFAKLNEIASHPGLWLALVTVVWFTTVALNGLEQVRLNNEIVATRNDEQSIAKVLDRLVLPRHLTEIQKTNIGNFLSQFPSHEFSLKGYDGRDEEAVGYLGDIDQALLKGGWQHIATHPIEYSNDVGPGLGIFEINTVDDSEHPPNLRDRPAMLVREAFGLSGVVVDGGGGGARQDIAQSYVQIVIGPRRKDRYQICPPQ